MLLSCFLFFLLFTILICYIFHTKKNRSQHVFSLAPYFEQRPEYKRIWNLSTGGKAARSASQTFVCFARTSCSTLRLRRRLSALAGLVHASVARGIMGTYYAPPLGRTGLSVCPYFAFLPASLRYFFGLVFFDKSPLPARYQNKYDNSPAKLDSLQVLVEGHRFFRFPFRFTAGRDAPLFSVLAFFGGDAPLSYNMQKNFVFEQKKSTEFLQWTMLIIMLYFITVSRRLNVLAREYPALPFVPHVS